MADNTNINWFRSFGRSNSGGAAAKQQPPPSTSTTATTTSQHRPNPLTLQTRHTFHRTPTPTAGQSPTAESPPRHHNHRKSTGATLRTVSSFLSLKSSSRSSGQTSPAEAWPPEEPIRTPAPLAMLPLTEVDYYHHYEEGGRAGGGYGANVIGGWGRRGDGGGGDVGEAGGRTWHNPNLIQMTEMLGAAIMASKGGGKALDVS